MLKWPIKERVGMPTKTADAVTCCASGWVDPILAEGAGSAASPAAKMSLTFAFEYRDSPMQIYQQNLTNLSYNDSALLFWRNVTSGRDQGDVPEQVSVARTPPSRLLPAK